MNIKIEKAPGAIQSRIERRGMQRKLLKATQRVQHRPYTTLLRKFFADLIELVNGKWSIEYCEANSDFFCNLDYKSRVTLIKCDYIHLYQPDFFNVKIIPGKNDRLEIYRFEVYHTGCGIGTKLMNILNVISLMSKIPLELVIGTLGIGQTYRTDTNPERQVAFYEKLGFVHIVKSNYWTNTDAPYSMLLQIAQLQPQHP